VEGAEALVGPPDLSELHPAGLDNLDNVEPLFDVGNRSGHLQLISGQQARLWYNIPIDTFRRLW
jgi:hypothetical protein